MIHHQDNLFNGRNRRFIEISNEGRLKIAPT